ncbi:MAG: peptidylprolyl isomerase [Bacteroides sp.]|nr:peptidylprolyl isomerase [Eubacterium sp.]MCM1417219.1 peptidylprolyl isomerase [Roseburia sp.]MCM1461160.1 peptidylprolyl isomerase [Bacteroides sp.]
MKRSLRIFTALSAAVVLLSGCGGSSDKAPNPAALERVAALADEAADRVGDGFVYTEAKDGFTGNTGEVALNEGDLYALIRVKDHGDIKIKLFPEAAPYGVQNFIELAESGYFTNKSIHRIIGDFMIQGGSLNGDGTGGTSADGGEFYCEINSAMRHFYGALCYANAGGRNTCQFYIVNNKTPQTVNDETYASMATDYLDLKNQFEELRDTYDPSSYEYAYLNAQAQSCYTSVDGYTFLQGKDADGRVSAKYADVGGTPHLDGSYTVFGQTVEGFAVIDAISAVETDADDAPLKEILISSVTIHSA